MKRGMLWQIEEGQPLPLRLHAEGMAYRGHEAPMLAEAINRAAEYYRSKYGQTADTVELNPSMLPLRRHAEGMAHQRREAAMLEGESLQGVKPTIHTTAHLQKGVLWIGADVK